MSITQNNELKDLSVGGNTYRNLNEFNEAMAPKYALERSLIKNDELHDYSNIEKNNRNVFLNDERTSQGSLPLFKKYIINIMKILSKSDISISIPESHVTLIFDISVLSGKSNKDMLCMNMLITLKTLNIFGISFSVWMFADRSLCFCVKKPTEILTNAKISLIKDAYFLQRINPQSDVLSALYKVFNQQEELKSNLCILFSTFISSQILYKSNKSWQQKAYTNTRHTKVIGIIEPYQYQDQKVDDALNETLKNTENVKLIEFDQNGNHDDIFNTICNSTINVLFEIFKSCKNDDNSAAKLSTNILNIRPNAFDLVKYDNDTYICKNVLNTEKTNFEIKNSDKMQEVTVNASGNKNSKFEIIEISKMNFGDLNFSASILYPNKATRFELTSHGSIIDSQGLIKAYFTNFTNLNIFKQKTGEKIRDYCVDIIVDASKVNNIYSITHCFLSIVSLLLAIKELEIPCSNLVIAGTSIIPLLVDHDLRYLSNNDTFYSKLFSVLKENASQKRRLDVALEKITSHSKGNSTQRVLFVITDAILGKEQENKIINILKFIQNSGTTVIGIGLAPYRIEKIFTWSVWAKNPYMLRKALFKLFQSMPTQNVFQSLYNTPSPDISKEIHDLRNDIKNSKALEQFSKLPFQNTELRVKINSKAFDPTKFTGNYTQDSEFDSIKNDAFTGYYVLVMMFYEGKPQTDDEYITRETFINGPKDMPDGTFSPGEKIRQKGFDYDIVTEYKEALIKLVSGKYSIIMLCTASIGEKKGNEDENYFEPLLEGIKQFHLKGGALILFGENPPFIFEINCILEKLPGITVRLDPNFRNTDPGGKIMKASQTDTVYEGEFLNCIYNIKVENNETDLGEYNLPAGGLEELFEGKTLAKFINIDETFKVFSKTHMDNPSCIYRIPRGLEGVIFIDNGSSKLFNEYTEKGAARYIINLVSGSIHYSNLRNPYYNNSADKGIKVDVPIAPVPPSLNLFKPLKSIYPPLLISIIIDVTRSMFFAISRCRKKLRELVNKCRENLKHIDIYIQFIGYRDLHNLDNMIVQEGITDDIDKIESFIDRVKLGSGGYDGPENVSAGLETALSNIENKSNDKNFPNCRHVFILIGDAPNQDHKLKESNFPNCNEKNIPWFEVWPMIDFRMKECHIDQLIPIACDQYFTEMYRIWNDYFCHYTNEISKKRYLLKNKDSDLFDEIFVEHISKCIATMYKIGK